MSRTREYENVEKIKMWKEGGTTQTQAFFVSIHNDDGFSQMIRVSLDEYAGLMRLFGDDPSWLLEHGRPAQREWKPYDPTEEW